MIKEMKPGDVVYHIDRDEYGYPVEASGTAYLAAIADFIGTAQSVAQRWMESENDAKGNV